MQTVTTFQQAHQLLEKYAPANVARPAYTLEYMERFMDFLGNPQDSYKVVHVAGTSGKTSTCYYLASLLGQIGKKIGLSVSPYIDEMNERVQINLVPLPEKQFCEEFSVFLELVNQSNIQLTRFEFLSAFAFWEFARQKVDYVVMEVGMGGELDATNVISRPHKVSVITDIGLDHQGKLGGTVAEIAEKKAGIIQLKNMVFCYDQGAEVLAPIRDRARQKQADLRIVDQTETVRTLDFLPLFQQRNFGLASQVIAALLKRDGIAQLDDGQLQRAARVHIPARLEIFMLNGRTVILDGAHNAQKLTALAESLKQQYPEQPIAALVAFKAKQNTRVEQATEVLTGFAQHVIATSYGSPNSVEPYGEDPEIIAALCKINGFWHIETVADPVHAWRQLLARPEQILLVTGSFYLFNAIRPLLKSAS